MKKFTINLSTLDSPWLNIPYANIVFDKHQIKFANTNRLSIKRVETLFTKEPTTIPWLEAMNSGEVLVDIGANVGMYSIYAAIVSDVFVYSFEPEALNYAELNKNIFLNSLHGRVKAFCAAISNTQRVDVLNLGGFAEGLSHHDFGENTWSEDKDFGAIQTSKSNRLTQGCIAFNLDELVDKGEIPFPDHIKIDVDGIEAKVVEGCWDIINSEKLKTILIEIDHRIPSCLEIIDKMLSAGWTYSVAQLRTNRKVIFSEDQINNMRHKGLGGFNYIFFKDSKYETIFSNFLDVYTPTFKK